MSLLLVFVLLIIGCESEKENTLNREMQRRKNQVPNIGNMNNSNIDPKDLKIMTTFTPEQKVIMDKVTAVIYKNLEATQAEDVEAALETLDRDGPQLQSTKNAMEYVFEHYDMEYNLEDMRFLSVTNDEARVLYKQTTKAVGGTGFTNSRSIGIHTVKKSKDGKWRIFKTEYLSTEPL